MTSNYDVDGMVVVGQPAFVSEKRTLAWKFCNFASMDQKRGERAKSTEPLMSHGVPWSMEIFPRGHEDSDQSEVYVSMYIRNDGVEDIDARYSFCVGNRKKTIRRGRNKSKKSRGIHNAIKRENALASMENGDLIVKVEIQVYVERPQPLQPKRTHSRRMLELLESSKRSDVTFVVGGTVFRAHLNIIDTGAPVLAELADGADIGEEIVVDNVDSSIFNALLRYIYGEELPASEMMAKHARNLLDVADRFGCDYLKLLAESRLVEEINNSNAAELLLLAEAKSCALLKESALTFIKASAKAVMESPGWENVKQSASLMSEIMEAAFAHKTFASTGVDVENMAVATLRRKLQEEDLSEDGTREMLVERLKGHKAKKRRTEE